MTEIFELSLDDLTESPFNPRQIFDDAALQELATDILSAGDCATAPENTSVEEDAA